MIDVAVFMVLLTNQHTEFLSSMKLTNVTFTNNMAHFGGCLHIQTFSVNSASQQPTKSGKKDRSTSNFRKGKGVISQPYYINYYATQLTRGRIDMNISEGNFSHNVGGAITVNRDVSFVNISITKSDFINNSSPLQGGAMLVESIDEFYVKIEDCEFVENSARNEGSAIYVNTVTFKTGSILVRNVLFQRNMLLNPDFNEGLPMGGTLTLYVQPGHLKVLLKNVSFKYNKAAMGSLTLYSVGSFQELTIVDCNILGNSQDERFSYNWDTLFVMSYQLNFTLTGTSISENKGKPTTDTLQGPPIHLFVFAINLARINISGLHYKNNKGGGIYFVLGSNIDDPFNATFFLQDSCFENNELFSLGIYSRRNTSLQIKRVLFTANSFVSSTFHTLALFVLVANTQGNQIAVQDTTFEKNIVQNTIALFEFPPDAIYPNECKIRRWNNRNQVRFPNVTFRENQPKNSTVLRLTNGWNILSNCRFVDNFAVCAVSISERSTKLDLVNTSFEQTQKLSKATTAHYPHFRGFIFYASSGPINLTNTTLKVESLQDIDAYFMITVVNDVHQDSTA
ncbi:hypothetical protein ACROYT_G019080 [Oculina patagonica]